jgi:hypothetical protein
VTRQRKTSGARRDRKTGRLTVKEQAERDGQIVLARLKGETNADIAERFGLSVRTVRMIFQTHREAYKVEIGNIESLSEVADMLIKYEHLEGKALAMVDKAKNDATTIGAIRTVIDIMRERLHVLQAIGAMPNDLGTLRVEMDYRRTSVLLVEVLRRHKLPPAVLTEIQEVLRQGDQYQGLAAQAAQN